jgi:ribosome-binding protein aMBF1 (putative translation factor)
MKTQDEQRIMVREKAAATIKAAREQKGWTRYELAKRAGIGETHLHAIEDGEFSIRLDIFDKLLRALEIDCRLPFSK